MEKTKSEHESHRFGASGAVGLADDIGAPAGQITVTQGVFTEDLPLAGETVGRIRQHMRQRFADRFDLGSEDSEVVPLAVVDGNPVDDNTVVHAGEDLTFVTLAGKKGVR